MESRPTFVHQLHKHKVVNHIIIIAVVEQYLTHFVLQLQL